MTVTLQSPAHHGEIAFSSPDLPSTGSSDSTATAHFAGVAGGPGKAPRAAAAEPILPRIAQGDSAAVAEFMERYKPLIWWLARKWRADDIEDAVQEVLIELWKKADRFDPAKSSESTFVGMVARRRLIDRYRRCQRDLDCIDLEEMVLDPPSSDEGALEATAELALAGRAVSHLRKCEREVLMMSVQMGYSHSEIAGLTKLPLGTVKTHLRRAQMRLRAELARKPLPQMPS